MPLIMHLVGDAIAHLDGKTITVELTSGKRITGTLLYYSGEGVIVRTGETQTIAVLLHAIATIEGETTDPVTLA